MPPSPRLRAELSRRLRRNTPAHWTEFTALWMAFNALYGGEPDESERTHISETVRSYVSAKDARHILSRHEASIAKLISVPPGDMRKSPFDSTFRTTSERYVARLQSKTETATARLAAVAGLLYQVRCNLIHGSKRPDDARDRMLVQVSLDILQDLVIAVESGMNAEN